MERKLVVLLEEQQRELHKIRRRQEARGDLLDQARTGDANALALATAGGGGGGGGGGYAGPSVAEKKQAAQLMQSTETLMKFGFMSMSMTYFSYAPASLLRPLFGWLRAPTNNASKSRRALILRVTLVRTQVVEHDSGDAHCLDSGYRHTQRLSTRRLDGVDPPRRRRDTVSCTQVMAALHQNQAMGGGPSQGTGGPGKAYQDKLGGDDFKPSLKPGQMPGQETLKVSAWSVDDVARWLQTLSLGQYREAFVDAAVDGAFLYDLDDDDLRNTLGIEHRLHRKKILNMTTKLRASEQERNKQMRVFMQTGQSGVAAAGATPLDAYAGAGAADEDGAEEEKPLDFDEVMALVRHGKVSKLKAALEPLAKKAFDSAIVKVPYVEDFGTAYVDAYERETFNLNKVNDHGNTLLHVAAQNGNMKIAKVLLEKGANPNHQNKGGQTAGHFANAYQFYDFLSWLFDPAGGGADDTLENQYGLGPYDGLSVELENG